MFSSIGKTLTNKDTLVGLGLGAVSVLGLLGGAKLLKKHRRGCNKKSKCSGNKCPYLNKEPSVLTVAVTGAAG